MKKFVISVVFMTMTLLNICTASEKEKPSKLYDALDICCITGKNMEKERFKKETLGRSCEALDICYSPEKSYAGWFARQPADLKLAYKRLDEKGIEFRFEHEPVVRQERHQIRCEQIRDGIKKCINEKNYKGKFTLSITNPHGENYVDMGPDFYDEIINGESEKTLTDEEIESMKSQIDNYTDDVSINGFVKINFENKYGYIVNVLDGRGATTGY